MAITRRLSPWLRRFAGPLLAVGLAVGSAGPALADPANAQPTTQIVETARGEGNVVSPGAFVNTLARIGDNCIINTGAIVEHEVTVGSHVHLAPGVIVAGRVSIGDLSFVGAGSVVREYVTVGERVVVGAGSVVLHELASDVMAAGAPATVRKVNGARAGEEGRP